VRIAVLTYGRTGYLDAALRALHALGDDVLVVAPAQVADTDFGRLAMDSFAQSVAWTTPPEPKDLVATVDAFAPDVVLRMSWGAPAAYREVLRTRPASTLRVLMMDNVWLATPKQWLGRAAHRSYLNPFFDCVFVPSDRTEFFARRLGFDGARIVRGCWTADDDLFGAEPHDGTELAARSRFVAVGRLVEHKGADVLAAAYRAYRSLVAQPWDLDVVGIGPLAESFAGVPGVTMHGFQQPDRVAQLMKRSSCFVLPSRLEPYGVVVHEAACAALPLLCTDAAAAVPVFLQDGANGWTVPSADVAAWASALARMSTQPADRLAEMSRISRALASRMSTRIWARHVHDEFGRRLAARRGRSAPAVTTTGETVP